MLGRPTDYTTEIAKLICERLADGMTLREVCRDEAMPAESTVRHWALEDREGFFAQYAKAREIGYNSMADEVVEISDDGSNDWMERQDDDKKAIFVLNGEHVQRSRLRVDTRKWLLSKALPKVYGDKLVHAGEDGPIQVTFGWLGQNLSQSTTSPESNSNPSTTEPDALPASLPTDEPGKP